MSDKTKNKEIVVAKNMPVFSPDSESGLQRYIQTVQKFPYLTEKEEFDLAKAYQDTGDLKAAETLISSHLRLVVKVAYNFKNYGLPIGDLIAEGNIGLMEAVKKFDPDKGFRLTTYALWWIRALIQEFILSSWSLVKIGTAANQKKLFFGLKRIKDKLGVYEEVDLTPEKVKEIAKELDVREQDVYEMNSRMQGDYSLNTSVNNEDKNEHIDFLESDNMNQEEIYEHQEMRVMGNTLLKDGMEYLTEREQRVLVARRLSDNPVTLKDLADELDVSAERIRQIENRAFEKLKEYILKRMKTLDAKQTYERIEYKNKKD